MGWRDWIGKKERLRQEPSEQNLAALREELEQMTDRVRVFHFFTVFLRSVAVLTLPAELQIRWLRSIGLNLEGEGALCDELALEFDDGWVLVGQFADAGLLSVEARNRLGALNSQFTFMSQPNSGPDELQTYDPVWSLEALRSNPEWEKVRTLAGESIVTMAESSGVIYADPGGG